VWGGSGVREVFQTILEGPRANGLQAALASLLEWELDDLPNFAELGVYPNAVSYLTAYVEVMLGSRASRVPYSLAHDGLALGESGQAGAVWGGELHDPYPGHRSVPFSPTESLIFHPPLGALPRPERPLKYERGQ
jgi:hypothetical protein